MATELGKAYVQIVPSAKGISGSISNLMGGEATSAGKTAGSFLGGNLVKTLTTVIAAAGIGKAISATLMEGADLQQSLGGIETLFKDDADKVKQYATDAYKTAGLSANDYMESVTSFSASLLQSMGGDTAAAAETANMALIDMSDNANKMGTSMESIQDAYKGFAKQNYTMLDNLSLGYGGTKTEMERLLADATALSGVEYNIDNLDDVYQAIHVVQKEMGITGTTAKESAETFSGSMASMKASLSNFMGNLALGNDLKPSLEALAETTSTFLFQNLLPMLGNILSALPGAIVTFVQAAIPHIVKAGSNLMKSLGKSIMSVIPDALKPLAKEFGKVGELAGEGFSMAKDAVNEVWTTVSDFVDGIDWKPIVEGLENALQATIGFFRPWVDGIKNSVNIALEFFKGLWDSIKLAMNGDWSGAFETLKQTFTTAITGILDNIITVFTGMWDSVKALMSSIDWGTAAQTLISALGTAISSAISFLGDLGTAIKDWIFTSLGVTTWSGVGSKITLGISTAISNALGMITTIGTSIRDWIFDKLGVSDWTSVGSKIGDLIIAAITALVDFGVTVATALWDFITGAFDENSETPGNSVGETVVTAIIAGITALAETVAGIATTIWDWIKTAWDNIDWSTLGSDVVAGIKAGIAGAWDSFKTWVSDKASDLKGWFANPLGIESPSTVMRDEIGKWIPAGIGEGITDGMHFVTGAISSMTSKIKNTSIPMPELTDFSELGTLNVNGILRSSTIGNNQSLSDVNAESEKSNRDLTRYVQTLIEINEQILLKDNNTYLDGYQVSRGLDKPSQNYRKKLDTINAMKGGVWV